MGKRGRVTAQDDKVPALGMILCGSSVIILSGKVFTDEYNIYDWLSSLYEHKTVNQDQREYVREEDGDGWSTPWKAFGRSSGPVGHSGSSVKSAPTLLLGIL
ncbi:MAG: hypothetical protein IPN76_26420 [Saprospiraceae bacterium]|nr:hypothetical protein [Saprospiraceae bacterium]